MGLGVPTYTQTGFVRTKDALYANVNTQLYKLDDVEAFAWSPIGPDYGALRGADAAGRLYATGATPGGAATEVKRWTEGDAEWTPVAYANTPNGSLTVLPDGTVFFDDRFGGHVYRASAEEGANVFADCKTTEGCQFGLGVVGSDRDSNVYLLECPQVYEGRDHRYLWKVAHGTEAPKHLARLPDAYPYCISTQVLPDGTVMLVIASDNLTTGAWAIFSLSPGADTFEKRSADGNVDWGYQYVARDISTVYGWADGESEGGVIRASN